MQFDQTFVLCDPLTNQATWHIFPSASKQRSAVVVLLAGGSAYHSAVNLMNMHKHKHKFDFNALHTQYLEQHSFPPSCSS